MELDDETRITEITLQPDGRIFVFGLSREVLALLLEICPSDSPLHAIHAAQPAAEGSIP